MDVQTTIVLSYDYCHFKSSAVAPFVTVCAYLLQSFQLYTPFLLSVIISFIIAALSSSIVLQGRDEDDSRE